jgi:poly(rC)-binding protein 3/4
MCFLSYILLLFYFKVMFPSQATDDVKSAAVEAVLLLQEKINNDTNEDRMNFRLLVPNKVIGCLIGKGGSIVIDMRKKTHADIRISKGDKPRRASSSDELVEVLACCVIVSNI